jgi:hypothetical protein
MIESRGTKVKRVEEMGCSFKSYVKSSLWPSYFLFYKLMVPIIFDNSILIQKIIFLIFKFLV